MPENINSALVCLSGGVDSTAALLHCYRKFDRVRAVYVYTGGKPVPTQAIESTLKLGVEFITADAVDIFKKEILDFTQRTYSKGQTPNPCAICNAKVKLAIPFSILRPDEFLVTGHYAKYQDGILSRGCDPSKDQSYFLSLVSRKILDRCYFPLESSLKTDVRKEVLENNLPFITSESQDLCFDRGKAGIPGDIVNTDGEVVGVHTGLDGYTPGQRKGLGAHSSRKFVIELDPFRNRLIIGDEENLYSANCMLNNINWLSKPETRTIRCMVQTRYRKPAADAELLLNEDYSSGVVQFCKPQKAVAPGQVGAIFLSERVLGGGVIQKYEGDADA